MEAGECSGHLASPFELLDSEMMDVSCHSSTWAGSGGRGSITNFVAVV